MVKTAPYGTWESPITADALVAKAITLSDVLVDPVTSEVYHVEGRPSEGGRGVIVHTSSKKDMVSKDFNVRTKVHEYGGSCVAVRDSVIYFSNLSDGRIYSVSPNSEPSPVTQESEVHRFADFAIHPKRPSLLVCVMEDHTKPEPANVVNQLVLVDVESKSLAQLASGADFYAAPRWSPDGSKLAWFEWHHPDMSWEGSELYVAPFSLDTGKIGADKHLAGKKKEVSIGYPFWGLNGEVLYFLSDEGGSRFQNPWVYKNGKAQALLSSPLKQEFGGPAWLIGWEQGVPLDQAGKRVLFVAVKGGQSVWHIVDASSGQSQEVSSLYIDIVTVRRIANDEIVFIGAKVDETKSVVRAAISQDGKFTYETLKLSNATAFQSTLFSVPQPITLEVQPGDQPLYVVYYPPTNPEYSGSSIPGEKPPCLFSIHGGPTSHSSQGLSMLTQFFTSRGFGWVDVDYGGSSGYGRAYAERLAGQWGVVDVQDTINAGFQLAEAPHNLIDLKRLCIRGGSAGGYTALAALCDKTHAEAFSAGCSFYGVSDLKALASETHKFESQYAFKLIGGTPDEKPEIYQERSPINNIQYIRSPLLILQGSDDKVVPPNQAEFMAEEIKKKGGKVEYKLYDGEGHGWRGAGTIKDALNRELGFYRATFGMDT